MKQEWHYTLDSQRYGPVSAAELKQLAASGKLQPDDKVKKEGMTSWVAASQIKGLIPDLNDTVQQKADSVGKTASTVSKVAKATGKVADAVSHVAEAGDKVQRAVTAVAGIAAGSSTLVGSLGDFLRPLGPINFVIFVVALLSGGVLFVMAEQKSKVRIKVRLKLGAVASLAVAAIFGLWTGLGAVAGQKDRGFLATNIKPVERLQEAVVPERLPRQEPPSVEPPPDTSKNEPPIGTWVEERTEKAGDRIREFRADGTLILHMPKSGQTFKGSWKWGQGKVFLSEDGKAPVEDRWFTIVASDERSMTILMMGTRRYVWTRSPRPLEVNLP